MPRTRSNSKTKEPNPALGDLRELEKSLGYRFRSGDLLEQALTHKSHAYESGNGAHNESMEFLGDAVLGFLVTSYVYRGFPDAAEGRKSKIKAYLVSASTLAALSNRLGIPSFLRLGRGEEKTGGRKKKALAANAFEAVVAAIYLDSGVEAAGAFLEPLYRPLLKEVMEGRAAVEDPKTALQEHLQAEGLAPPKYHVTAETGPEHRKVFHVELTVGSRRLGSAKGSTKKKAEILAAQQALGELARKQES